VTAHFVVKQKGVEMKLNVPDRPVCAELGDALLRKHGYDGMHNSCACSCRVGSLCDKCGDLILIPPQGCMAGYLRPDGTIGPEKIEAER
jgi:hypothetical protein